MVALLQRLFRLWREAREPMGVYVQQVKAFGEREPRIKPLDLPPIRTTLARRQVKD